MNKRRNETPEAILIYFFLPVSRMNSRTSSIFANLYFFLPLQIVMKIVYKVKGRTETS